MATERGRRGGRRSRTVRAAALVWGLWWSLPPPARRELVELARRRWQALAMRRSGRRRGAS